VEQRPHILIFFVDQLIRCLVSKSGSPRAVDVVHQQCHDVTGGSSVIAFLRPTSDRYTPFVTLEIYHGYILQAKGKNDSAPPAEVQEWLRQYADKHHLIIHEKAYAHAGQYYV